MCTQGGQAVIHDMIMEKLAVNYENKPKTREHDVGVSCDS